MKKETEYQFSAQDELPSSYGFQGFLIPLVSWDYSMQTQHRHWLSGWQASASGGIVSAKAEPVWARMAEQAPHAKSGHAEINSAMGMPYRLIGKQQLSLLSEELASLWPCKSRDRP